MVKLMKVCTSCNKEVTQEFVEFPCPKCGKHKIIRCLNCRITSKTYKCDNCGFEGP
ncbi:MAG: zinc finger domain-containing protein [archaeon]|nr:zinc finger domain-containing protein [archaeon]